jgi:hypothetical protein
MKSMPIDPASRHDDLTLNPDHPPTERGGPSSTGDPAAGVEQMLLGGLACESEVPPPLVTTVGAQAASNNGWVGGAPDARAPRAVPRFDVLVDARLRRLPLFQGRRPVRRIDVDDKASLQRAIAESRVLNPLLPTVYVVDSEKRLSDLLADANLRPELSGLVPNVFLKARAKGNEGAASRPSRDSTALDSAGARDGYLPVRLRGIELYGSFVPRLAFEPDARTPYRIEGSDRWQAPATIARAKAYFSTVFEAVNSAGEPAVPRRPLAPEERFHFEKQSLFAPRQAPEHIAVGPHVDFTRVYTSREDAHAAFGRHVGPIANAALAAGGGPLADEPLVEYSAFVVPHRLSPEREEYQLLPPVISANNGRGFCETSDLYATLTHFDRQALGRDVPGSTWREPDDLHTHFTYAPHDAGRYATLMRQEQFSATDLRVFLGTVSKDPEFVMSVYVPSVKATQLIGLSDKGRSDWLELLCLLDVCDSSQPGLAIARFPSWFSLTGVRTRADGSVRRTDWLQTLQEAESPEVREVARRMVELKQGAAVTLEDFFLRDLIYRAAVDLDTRPP